jgi:hypothetical protein
VADNIDITPGTGKTVLTDDCTTGHAQVVKLAIATDGSATLIPSDGTDGLLVNLGTNNDVTIATLPALVAGDANIGNVDIVTVPAPLSTTGGGTEATALRVTLASDSTGLVSVDDNASSLTVDAPVGTPVFVRLSDGASPITTLPVSLATPGVDVGSLGKQEGAPHTAGNTGVLLLGVRNTSHTAFTGVAQGDYSPINVDAEGCVVVVGNVNHDTADADAPVKIGGYAVSGSASPTSVAAADRTRFIANQHGVPYVIAGHPNLITREYDFGTAAQTDVNLAAAVVAADERIYVTRFEAMCDNANTVSVSVRAGFGTANVPTASATGVSGMIGSHPGVAPGSGFVCGTGAAIIAVGGAGEEPRITTSAATTGNLHVVISYFLIDETP